MEPFHRFLTNELVTEEGASTSFDAFVNVPVTPEDSKSRFSTILDPENYDYFDDLDDMYGDDTIEQ